MKLEATNVGNKINFGNKILVAEDDDLTRRLIIKFLNKFDTFEIQEAKTKKEAIKVIHSVDKLDLVITDGHMGSSSPMGNDFDADGINVIKAAKEHKYPTILCSGDSNLRPIAEELGSNVILKDVSKFGENLNPLLAKIFDSCK